ncbi:MAG: hypothetical protein J4F48_14635, partial [Nitrospinae bacterium]|nr:hypothetical protein [Nitrospinota bacterium]
RRIWARTMKEKYGAKNPKTMQLKFSTGNCGSRMAAREPLNNIVRQTLYTLAAVLGGTRSVNMACFDEAFEIPSDESIRTALRIQQVIAHESGVADTVDPLAGGYAVEAVTDQVEEEIQAWTITNRAAESSPSSRAARSRDCSRGRLMSISERSPMASRYGWA